MHLLYIHQHFTTPRGKGGIRSYQMARRMIERGHRVTMICGTFAGGGTGLDGPFERGVRRGLVDGIEVIEVDLAYSNRLNFLARTGLFFRFALTATRLALTTDYDVVFATTTPLTVAIPGVLARWLRRKPFVFEVRDLWPELPRAMGVITNPVVLAAMSMLEWSAYRSADRLIGLAPGIVEGIRDRGVSEDQIAAVPNGCDIDIFDAAAPVRIPGTEPGDVIAIFAGTHGLANGLDRVLAGAAVLARRKRNDIKIVLVGDGQCKPALMADADREGLQNVVFLPPTPKGVLAGYMKSADIGLQSLRNVPAFYNGTSPNKFFDYPFRRLARADQLSGLDRAVRGRRSLRKGGASRRCRSVRHRARATRVINLTRAPRWAATHERWPLVRLDRDLLGMRWVEVVEGAASARR